MAGPHPTQPPAAEASTVTNAAVIGERDGGDGRFDVLIGASGGVGFTSLVPGRTYRVGRAPGADIVIDDVSVSRAHAIFRVRDAIEVEDAGSSNGTRVNNRALVPGERARVGLGGVIELGSAVLIVRAHHDSAAREAEGSPPRRPLSGRRLAVRAPALATPLRIAGDARMEHLYSMIDLVAPTMVSVLVLGETGVGKEVFASEIHARSKRADRAFLKLNCAAIAESLLESELFGHEKGAFTGAVATKPGLLESAHGGTVFLDEIGEMPLLLQAKLLRFLETGEVLPIGSVVPRRVDVRVVAATNRDLNEAMHAGTFRTDLYFRLNGITLTIPPLRERKAEIAPLAARFAELSAAKHGLPVPEIERETLAILESRPWVGNVRELRNVIDLATALWGGAAASGITPAHLTAGAPPMLHVPTPTTPDLGSTTLVSGERARGARDLASELRELEKQRIEEALALTGWNQSKAARKLGVTRAVLMHRIKTFGLVRPHELDDVATPSRATRRP